MICKHTHYHTHRCHHRTYVRVFKVSKISGTSVHVHHTKTFCLVKLSSNKKKLNELSIQYNYESNSGYMILFLNLTKLTKSDSVDHFEYLYSQNLLQAKLKHPIVPFIDREL